MPRHTLKNANDLDATDLTLLQFPELWDNTLKTYYDIYFYGATAPEEKAKPCVMFAPKCDFCENSCQDLEESIGFVKLKDFEFIHACCTKCKFKLQKKISVFSLMTCDMIVYYETKKTSEIEYHTEGKKIVKTVVKV